MTLKLQDGKLYSSATQTQRFRVENIHGKWFSCSSLPAHIIWDNRGKAWDTLTQKRKGVKHWDLTEEVEQTRIVPISQEKYHKGQGFMMGRHAFEWVSREEAKRRFPGSNPEKVEYVDTSTFEAVNPFTGIKYEIVCRSMGKTEFYANGVLQRRL